MSYAAIVKKNQFVGWSSILILLGVVVTLPSLFGLMMGILSFAVKEAGLGLFMTFISSTGTALGIILFAIGIRMAALYQCSSCGMKLADKSLLVCPNCRSEFSMRPK